MATMAEATSPAPTRPRRLGVVVRLVLAAAAVLTIPLAILLGQRAATLSEFNAGVASGDVRTVHLVGALPPGVQGEGTVDLVWRQGLVTHVTQVRQVSDANVQSNDSANRPLFTGDIAAQLSAAHPGLRVVSDPGSPYTSGWSANLLGWQVTGPLALEPLVVGLGALAVLVGGAEPWRATRWAWFWLMLTPLAAITIPLFLLLSGPAPLIPAPKRPDRRLRGGWAFVLATLVAGIKFA